MDLVKIMREIGGVSRVIKSTPIPQSVRNEALKHTEKEYAAYLQALPGQREPEWAGKVTEGPIRSDRASTVSKVKNALMIVHGRDNLPRMMAHEVPPAYAEAAAPVLECYFDRIAATMAKTKPEFADAYDIIGEGEKIIPGKTAALEDVPLDEKIMRRVMMTLLRDTVPPSPASPVWNDLEDFAGLDTLRTMRSVLSQHGTRALPPEIYRCLEQVYYATETALLKRAPQEMADAYLERTYQQR